MYVFQRVIFSSSEPTKHFQKMAGSNQRIFYSPNFDYLSFFTSAEKHFMKDVSFIYFTTENGSLAAKIRI